MESRSLAYWIVEVAGTFVCIAAVVNIGGGLMNETMFGGSLGVGYYLSYVSVLVLGILVVLAGYRLKPGDGASTK